ncbi:MAG: cysteine hydrolase family protein [Candidatus Thiodiazotropha sp.]
MKTLIGLLLLLPSYLLADGVPKTLLEMAGLQATPATLSESVLVVIDAQREYIDGALPLKNIDEALTQGRRLLLRARAAGIPIVHVVHRGGGALFNPESPYFAIASKMAPEPGELTIEKRLPNAFAGTSLLETLKSTGRKMLIIVGFMTHMCLDSTVRAALDQGYFSTVVASVTATRDLPDGQGGIVPAEQVQQVILSTLADRFAVVVQGVDDIQD